MWEEKRMRWRLMMWEGNGIRGGESERGWGEGRWGERERGGKRERGWDEGGGGEREIGGERERG